MEANWPQSSRVKLLYGVALLVVQFLIPTLIMAYCYWKILQKANCFRCILNSSKTVQVRQDWLVPTSNFILSLEQQAQTAMRKRRVMYVLILMVMPSFTHIRRIPAKTQVLIFMGSWMPLTFVNLLRDLNIR